MARPMTPERFLERLIEVHNGEIVALETYKGSKHKIMFDKTTCDHSSWLATPNSVLAGSGCPACARERAGKTQKLTNEEFLSRLEKVHNGEIVALESYRNSKSKIMFNKTTCNHKPWLATPNQVLQGKGCPRCGREKAGKTQTLTNEEFLSRLEKVHNGEIVAQEPYRGNKCKIMFNKTTCNHKPWLTTPERILRGTGCPECWKVRLSRSLTLTSEDFLLRLNEVHDGEVVALEDYKGSKCKIMFDKITCEHEPWLAEPGQILQGTSCPKCKGEKSAATLTLTNEEFLLRLEKVHNGEIVALSPYRSQQHKMMFNKITCEHEPWITTTRNVLRGTGCPLCRESKGERFVAIILSAQNVVFEREKRFPDCKYSNPLPFDFSVKLPCGKYLLIEIDGIFHREAAEGLTTAKDLAKQQKRDRIKDEYCKKNGHTLIRIPYYGTETLDDMRKILFATVGPFLDGNQRLRKP